MGLFGNKLEKIFQSNNKLIEIITPYEANSKGLNWKEIIEKEEDDEILNEKVKEPVNDSIKYSSFFTLSEERS